MRAPNLPHDPLAGYSLMEAIAREYRVYCEKARGIVVDLIDLADLLADALATYATRRGIPTSR